MRAFEHSPRRQRKIRSDRYPMPAGLGNLEVKGTRYELLNYSATGVAVVVASEKKPFAKDALVEANFYLDESRIASLRLRFLYQVPFEERTERAAFEIVGPLLDAEQVQATVEAIRLIREQEKKTRQASELNPEFRAWVQKTVCELKDLERVLKSVDTQLSRLPPSLRSSKQRGYILATAEFLHRRLRDFYSGLGEMLQACHSNEIPLYLQFFRDQFRDFLWRSETPSSNWSQPPTSRTAYGAIGLVLQGEIEGNDLFSKALTMYHFDLLNDEALQYRSHHIRQRAISALSDIQSKQNGVRLLSVASGINPELIEILKAYSSSSVVPIHATAIDSEMNFLLHTQNASREWAQKNEANRGSLHFEHWTVKESLESSVKASGPFDLIYSTYLLDCLSDEELLIYLAPLWEGLAPGGKLILANVGKEFHSSVAIELQAHWHLIARTSQDLANLGLSLTEDMRHIAIESDEAQVNLFLVLGK